DSARPRRSALSVADGSGVSQGTEGPRCTNQPRDLPRRGPRHQTTATPRRRFAPRTGAVREVRQEVVHHNPPRIPTLSPLSSVCSRSMNRREFLATVPAAAVASQLRADEKLTPSKIGPNDWPWWRGPTRDGVAAPQKIPLEWAADKNVLWETPVPGRGHGA